MRWEDERYVRVYTRDTGDWLGLSFEAQALFLMLLRKVDRIGELHLGRRGLDSVPALLGHPDKAERLTPALRELLADGCVRLADDGAKLFVPNFLKAQEAAKSPAERKREQRERDAAKALENTHLSRDVTPGHEMSLRTVPSRAVPCRTEPAEPGVTTNSPPPVDPVSAPGALNVPTITAAALPDRRAVERVERPDKPAEDWDATDFWRWAQDRRQATGYLPERMPAPRKLSGWWSEARAIVHEVKRLKAGFYRYGEDDFWKATDPPYPFHGFMSQWERFVPAREDSHAA